MVADKGWGVNHQFPALNHRVIEVTQWGHAKFENQMNKSKFICVFQSFTSW